MLELPRGVRRKLCPSQEGLRCRCCPARGRFPRSGRGSSWRRVSWALRGLCCSQRRGLALAGGRLCPVRRLPRPERGRLAPVRPVAQDRFPSADVPDPHIGFFLPPLPPPALTAAEHLAKISCCQNQLETSLRSMFPVRKRQF